MGVGIVLKWLGREQHTDRSTTTVAKQLQCFAIRVRVLCGNKGSSSSNVLVSVNSGMTGPKSCVTGVYWPVIRHFVLSSQQF
ncbi:hypothetical protein E2C01_021085 [Portunus trituberculatus]|uniref:Uncharacterized protein n=1 Tax=Portunus trituberculatus TaxID=210409 RepID=A0A5B7E412_PORTR|nr:hypothetical protein [Portunus trituberculatus]